MKYVVVDKTNLVKKSGECQSEVVSLIQLNAGETLIEVDQIVEHQGRRVYFIDGQYDVRGPTIVPDYRARRKGDYPSIGDQLDMLWHAMDVGQIPKAQQFYNAIKAVKDKYPKS